MKIRNLYINYIDNGVKSKSTIVLLHGWGQNIEMMQPIGNNFADKRVIIIDLPGFGLSEEPKEEDNLTIVDYVDIVKELLDKLKIKNPILIGHSFGGKISLIYASKYTVEKLVILAAPFRKGIEKLSLKTKLLKKLKNIPFMNGIAEIAKKYMGSTDYKNASSVMRNILVDHVNLDITESVKKIKVPTIIIWGDHDEAVNIEDAYLLETLIRDSAVICYPGGTHYAYLENLGQTNNIIRSFIKED